MNDPATHPAPAASRRRRLILAGVGLVAGAALAAFIAGGNAPAPRRTDDSHKTADLVLDTQKTAPLLVLDDWGDFTAEGSAAAPSPAADIANAPAQPPLPDTTPRADSIPAPGNPVPGKIATASVPSAPVGTPLPVPTQTLPASTPASSLAQAGSPAPAASVPAAAAIPAPARPGAGPAPASSPLPTVASTAPVIPAARPGPAPVVASANPVPGNPPASTRPSPASAPERSADDPPPAAVAAARPASPAAPAPAFKQPRSRRTGIVSQTKGLVRESEFTPRPAVPSAPAVTAPPPAECPAVVTLPEAKAYSACLTETLRRERYLSPTQTVRLPSTRETANPKVWRHDDASANPAETRPFGLIVEETDPAARQALAATEEPATSVPAKPSHTSEGIPLRTDIPEGTSPLHKNTPDQPLWKRP